jgi:hypothetical protein
MLDKISKLHHWLKANGYDESNDLIRIASFSKVSFINNAYIGIDDSRENMVRFFLFGDIKGEEHKFGEVYVDKLDYDFISPFETDNFWQVHAPGLDYEYIRLGYGKDLYLTAIKYVTELGGKIISGPLMGSLRTKDAASVHERLGNLPGVKSIQVSMAFRGMSDPVVLTELTSENKRILESTGEDYDPRLYSVEIKNGENFYNGVSGEVGVGIGNIIWATNPSAGRGKEGRLPISLPVKKREEGDSPGEKWEEENPQPPRYTPEWEEWSKRQKAETSGAWGQPYQEVRETRQKWLEENPEPPSGMKEYGDWYNKRHEWSKQRAESFKERRKQIQEIRGLPEQTDYWDKE